MKYQPAGASDAHRIADIYNRMAAAAFLLPIGDKEAGALFLEGYPLPVPGISAQKTAVFAEKDGIDAGFAAGNASVGAQTGYVTVLLAPDDETRHALLDELIAAMREKNPALRRLRWVFYNPCLLRWRLPGPEGFSHPGLPGVPEDSTLYGFLLTEGWRVFARMNVYARALADYRIPDTLREKIAENAASGLSVRLWDPSSDGSFRPLTDALGSEDWRRTLLANEASEDPLPVMIAADEREEVRMKNNGRDFVCGFAGPMRRTDDGRGYFAGIGIHPDYRRRGLGSTLFAMLCDGLRTLGADYMTLFTGADGTAHRIYEAAGFEARRAVAAMECDLVPTDVSEDMKSR
ncbi:MAG: GNAT family N-acetyltransferase [Clostridia bacterium]|nr:GNAT family N-acetyltransferase [Clostridia bacterium]